MTTTLTVSVTPRCDWLFVFPTHDTRARIRWMIHLASIVSKISRFDDMSIEFVWVVMSPDSALGRRLRHGEDY